MSDLIELNGKQLTKEEFEEEKKRIQEQHMKLVEVTDNVYKTRLED
jgi:hypothetical protein